MSVIIKEFSEPPYNYKEILRYLNCEKADDNIRQNINECISELNDKLRYSVCYTELFLDARGDTLDFGDLVIISKDLSKNLCGCKRVVLFSATIGIEIDRLISKYGLLTPSKALILQSIGAERIESLCDAFCDFLQEREKINEGALRPRFSVGYGDCPIEAQRDILRLLDSGRKIGLTLTESCLMTPTKSVTAFVGIKEQ